MDLKLHFASHPSEDVLEAYALQRLDGAQIASVETHLLACDTCQDALAEIDRIVSTMAGVRDLQAQERLEVAKARDVPPEPPQMVVLPAEPSVSLWHKLTSDFKLPQFAVMGAVFAAAAIFLAVSSRPNLPLAQVTLSSYRGSDDAAMAHAPARAPLELSILGTRLDVRAGFKLEMVDSTNTPVWHGELSDAGNGRFASKVTDKLGPGMYWVRLYDPSVKLVQEFGLRLD